MAFAKYTLAVDRRFKKDGGPTADFINCTAIGKQAEFAEMYLHQGMKILVVGSWQTGSYTNRDGNKVYTNECLVTEHYFCESKNENAAPNYSPNTQPTYNQNNYNGNDGFMNIPEGIDDELPFS